MLLLLSFAFFLTAQDHEKKIKRSAVAAWSGHRAVGAINGQANLNHIGGDHGHSNSP